MNMPAANVEDGAWAGAVEVMGTLRSALIRLQAAAREGAIGEFDSPDEPGNHSIHYTPAIGTSDGGYFIVTCPNLPTARSLVRMLDCLGPSARTPFAFGLAEAVAGTDGCQIKLPLRNSAADWK